MKLDPYAELGVQKDADTVTIRKAYRMRSKETHPDNGGSEDKFALTKLSHDILIDPKRRQRFDQTGDASESEADNALAKALQNIFNALDAVLAELTEKNQQPINYDLTLLLIDKLNSAISEGNKQKVKLDRGLKIYLTLQGRWKSLKKEQVERIEPLIAAKLGAFKEALERIDSQIKTLQDAIVLLGNETFQYDPLMQQSTSASPMYTYIIGR